MSGEKTDTGTCIHALECIVIDALGEEFWVKIKNELNEDKGSLGVLRELRVEIIERGLADPEEFAKKYPITSTYIHQRKKLGYGYDGLVYEGEKATWKNNEYKWGATCLDSSRNGHRYWNELDHSITFLICKIKDQTSSGVSLNKVPLSTENWVELGLYLFLAEACSHRERITLPIGKDPFDDVKITIDEVTYSRGSVKFAKAIGIYEEFFK